MRKEVIAHKDPKSPTSEVFRTLRTNIQFMNTKNKLKTLLITSTSPGEGKSWVSSNLAVTFAQAGKKVILVDADMRKGRQYNIFGVSPRPGLSNYLSGIGSANEEEASMDLADYIQETEVENLYVMAAGNIPPNPSELLISPQMVKLLNQLKELSDIVVIDGTPNELVTDSLILARLVDSTVIVTAHKQTRKDSLQRIITNIQNIGGKIAGIVVNKMPVSQRKYQQSYYYGSTSSRNSKNTDFKKAINLNVSKKSNSEEMKRRVMTELNKTYTDIEKTNLNENNSDIQYDDELPKSLQQKDIEVEKSETIPLDKANDILKQINEFLDNEKKNLNQ